MRFTEIFESVMNNTFLSEKAIKKGLKIQSLEDFFKDAGVEMLEEAELGDDLPVEHFDDEKLNNNLNRAKNRPNNKPIYKKNKDGKEVRVKNSLDYKEPMIHSTTAKNITIEGGGESFDLEALKTEITKIPDELLKRNEKMKNSSGVDIQFYNFGIPALKGLLYDEKEGKFNIVSTCPKAGECQLFCYAKKGGYIQYNAPFLKATNTLNYLINHPKEFADQLSREISDIEKNSKKKKTQVVIRWHDSGDFFSKSYLDLVFSVAKKHPEVRFYAYTKMANVANSSDKPDNFIFTFSEGGSPKEAKQINSREVKNSIVVPKIEFEDYVKMKGRHFELKDKKMQYKDVEHLKEFKQKMLKKMHDFIEQNDAKFKDLPKQETTLTIDEILTYDELLKIPEGNEFKYVVIVGAGDGDLAAARKDVVTVLLLIH